MLYVYVVTSRIYLVKKERMGKSQKISSHGETAYTKEYNSIEER